MLDHAAQELTQALGLVAKLKSGRESKKRATGKGCGRKSLAELSPEAVALELCGKLGDGVRKAA